MQVTLYENKLYLNYFLYEIVHHCNLNCKSCDHCSPLAKEEFINLKSYERDLKQMTKWFYKIKLFGIMGGEPLLHPKLIKIIEISRKKLPKDTRIQLYTNGILLNSLPEIFWKSLSKYKTDLVITNYRLNIDYNKIIQTANKYKVIWYFEGDTGRKEKLFTKPKLDIHGNQDIKNSHDKCWQGQVCTTLENGRLYKCPVCSASRHFNDYFGTNLTIDDKDSINIYKTTKDEILNYFMNPIPFCRYCDIEHRTENQKWSKSNKDIQEWT